MKLKMFYLLVWVWFGVVIYWYWEYHTTTVPIYFSVLGQTNMFMGATYTYVSVRTVCS